MDSNNTNSNLTLEELNVIDLADEKGSFCTKLFADLGANVIKVEKPGGDPTRNIGPFMNDDPHDVARMDDSGGNRQVIR